MEQYIAALNIVKELEKNGFSAYIVGGYVRDTLLNIKSNDIDITTNALPDDLNHLFKTIDSTANKYLSCKVMYEGYEFEITTFRTDIEYINHRHPVTKIVENLEEDLKRRDFTINALALDSRGKIIDLCDGLLDIKNKLVRVIGDSFKRFDEDVLRIFRGCYLVSKLNFDIEDSTFKGMQASAKYVTYLSDERIFDELTKILKFAHYKKALSYLIKTSVLNYLKLDKVIEYVINSNVRPSIDDIIAISIYINTGYEFKVANNKKRLYFDAAFLAKEGFTNLNLYKYDLDTIILADKIRAFVDNRNTNFDELVKTKLALPISSRKDLKVNANDLIKYINKPQGPWINELLHKIEKAVLENKIKNEKSEILNFIKEDNDV